jgi:outer membrane protein
MGMVAIMGLQTQAQSKIGHINTQDLLEIMPGMTAAQDSLQKFNDAIQEQYVNMTNELQTKFENYQSSVQAAKDRAILDIMEKEIQRLQNNIKEFEESANENLVSKREDLMNPILEKAENAIKEVAKDGNYAYILDSTKGGAVLYSAESSDVMDLVKKKLGI